MTLAQDNALFHAVGPIKVMLAQNHICVLPWPAKLVHSNPIENLWDLLKLKVKARRQPFNLPLFNMRIR
jgi:transposase